MELRVAIGSVCVLAVSCAQIAGVEDGELSTGGTGAATGGGAGIGGTDASVTGGSAGAVTGGSAGIGGGAGSDGSAGTNTGGAGGAAPSYADVILADKPVAYWRLGESTTPTAFDATGNGHDGIYKDVIIGEPGAIANDTDTAVRFKGVFDAGVEIGDKFDFVGHKPFSVELWVKPESPEASIIGKTERIDGGPHLGWFLYHETGRTTLRRGGLNIEGPGLTQGQWTHVVAGHDGATSFVYLDGVLGKQRADDKSLPDLMKGLRIGGIDQWQRFKGVLDEVAIYDKNLSPAQIKAHYQAGIGQ